MNHPAVPEALRLTLQAPDRVASGEAVSITFRVENTGGRPMDLYLRGRTVTFDVVVSDAEGAVVWRRLEGEVVPAILRIETLAPGQALELTERWDQRTRDGRPVPAGRYAIRAELLTEDAPIGCPNVRVRIEG